MLAWIGVEPLSGTELERARAVVAEATHTVKTRFREGISARKRFVFGERTLNIENVRNIDERNRELVCICVEQT